MELGLSLGDAAPASPNTPRKSASRNAAAAAAGLDFCMDLTLASPADANRIKPRQESDDDSDDEASGEDLGSEGSEGDAPLQLNLLPLSPVPRPIPPNFLTLPWTSDAGVWEKLTPEKGGPKGLDVNGLPAGEETYGNSGEKKRRIEESAMGGEGEKTSSRASDEEENGANSRKKLRLSKEQSAFLEESFKEHHTLNPKQKLGLAKQLNLRPRQVEVWFQNRRARTKLKQTEVDCEYLKRCCDTLTEENRRLHKELQELRALKASSSPFYPHRPATTLTMCPSCERVVTAPPPPPSPAPKPFFYPFPTHPNQHAASS